PSVMPAEVIPGTEITITCPITSACDKEQTVTAKCIIYEGSILPTHGTKITTKTSPAFALGPEETKNMVVTHTAIEGTIDRRDIEVEVYIAGYCGVFEVKCLCLTRCNRGNIGQVVNDFVPAPG
ncbi:unnamed protein product, partial [marine sediment metagenome]